MYQTVTTATPDLSCRIGQDPYAGLVVTRLMEMLSESSPWSRRLWDVGSVLALHEAFELTPLVRQRTLSDAAASWLSHNLERQLGEDRGLGEARLRKELVQLLRSGLPMESTPRRRFKHLLPSFEEGYLRRWRESWDRQVQPSPERLARAVASHLLDKGYSMSGLHRWIRRLASGGDATLRDLFMEAEELAQAEMKIFEVLVPFESVPHQDDLAVTCPEWLSPRAAAEWFHREQVTTPPRHNGGFCYQIAARDAVGASRIAGGFIQRLQARASYGRGLHTRLVPHEKVWISGIGKPIPLKLPNRRADVPSLIREGALYLDSRSDRLDDILELAAVLNTGPPAPAVTGAWAAIEALLYQPGDLVGEKVGRAIAADRLAMLAACNWPRAELTILGYRHHADDELARKLDGAESNRERCAAVASAIQAGHAIQLPESSDRAALQRLSTFLTAPLEYLQRIQRVFERTLRRFYRLRNIVVHGGSTESVAFEAGLRIAAPIIGVGLDRIVHARLSQGLSALDLVARAENSLALFGDPDGPTVIGLLD